jgi:hypothetical protein
MLGQASSLLPSSVVFPVLCSRSSMARRGIKRQLVVLMARANATMTVLSGDPCLGSVRRNIDQDERIKHFEPRPSQNGPHVTSGRAGFVVCYPRAETNLYEAFHDKRTSYDHQRGVITSSIFCSSIRNIIPLKIAIYVNGTSCSLDLLNVSVGVRDH